MKITLRAPGKRNKNKNKNSSERERKTKQNCYIKVETHGGRKKTYKKKPVNFEATKTK